MRTLLLSLLACFMSFGLWAQVPTINKMLNMGQSQPQDISTLPVSRSATKGKLQRTAPYFSPARLVDNGDDSWKIVSGWKMQSSHEVDKTGVLPVLAEYDTTGWYDATVPGTVLTTLVNCGVYPDPYYGLNNMEIPDTLCRMDWWYRVEIPFPKDKTGQRTSLVFKGINYRAEVWFNQNRLGTMTGAFVRGIFDITDLVEPDKPNVLAVRIMPPFNPGIPHEESVKAGMGNNGGVMCLDGPTFFASEGWDWIPAMRDRNMGIWQDVLVKFHGDVSIGDPQIISDLPLPDTSYVDMKISVPLKNHSLSDREVEAVVSLADVEVSKKVSLAPGAEIEAVFTKDEFPALRISNPKLWWPNGMGEQNLYSANITVKQDGKISDTKKVRFGVREYEYMLRVADKDNKEFDIQFNPTEAYAASSRIFDNINVKRTKSFNLDHYLPRLLVPADAPGITVAEFTSSPHIVVKINGCEVFCKGGNWGMDDGMKRVSRERLEPAFKLHKFQNFNMIRTWCGQVVEDVFYELCDEYGMMVFNDFWMSTTMFNLPPANNDLFMNNATDVVLRYRNHPSIALWCARNEGFAPKELEKRLSSMLAEADGTRHYLASSTNINTGTSGPWQSLTPETYTDPGYFRSAYGFRSEAGYSSVPTYRTLEKFMEPEDRWPMGDVWSYHDWHSNGWPDYDKYARTLAKMYGDFANAEEFCNWSQIENYRAWRAMCEAWNGRLWNDATGFLLWMSHPAWPSSVWQTYTYDWETTGAYYATKNACEPEHIQMNLTTKLVQILNFTRSDKEYTAVYAIYSPEGKLLSTDKKKITVGANGLSDWCELDGQLGEGLKLLRLTLRDRSGRVVSQNDYWVDKAKTPDYTPLRNMGNADVRVDRIKRDKDGSIKEIRLKNDSDNIALGVKLNLRDKQTEDYILPAFFSDGFFILLPGEQRDVALHDGQNSKNCYVSVEWINMDSDTAN